MEDIAIREDETLASIAYQKLLHDILWGRLAPGRKLALQALRERYGIGNSPLREALNRLAQGGMVIREENRGFRVSPVTAEELEELTKTRCWLEEIALRESIEKGDRDWEARVVLAHHWLSRVPRTSDVGSPGTTAEWEERHKEYHLALLSACGSRQLVDFCAQLHDQTLRYRNAGAMKDYRERHEATEHAAIVEAALGRDADKAVELLCAHYRATNDIVVASLGDSANRPKRRRKAVR
jgi:DNA-binding GntR family transcriptional regulator